MSGSSATSESYPDSEIIARSGARWPRLLLPLGLAALSAANYKFKPFERVATVIFAEIAAVSLLYPVWGYTSRIMPNPRFMLRMLVIILLAPLVWKIWRLWIDPSIFPTIPAKSGQLRILSGEGRRVFDLEKLRQREEIFADFGTNTLVKLALEEENLLFDSYFLGQSPNFIPKLTYRFSRFLYPPFGWDSQQSANAIELVDKTGAPVLQFIWRNPETIEINGNFEIGEEQIFLRGTNTYTEATRITSGIGKSVKPLFRYPSWRYPHELAITP
jgi:hypothetical protein